MGNHEEFTEYATAAAARLRKVGYLMCHDWHQAQDLTQVTLAKVFVNWSRIRRRDNVDVYARQILVREFLNTKRQRSATERPTAQVPDRAGRGDRAELRLTLLEALRSLSPNQRTVIILRYWEDQSVEQVAAIMMTTPGAVKGLAVRGLRELRVLLGDDFTIEAAV